MIRRMLALVLVGIFVSGCGLADPFVRDIGGWDLTACTSSDGFDVCWELFSDNQHLFFGDNDDSGSNTTQVSQNGRK